MDAKEVMTHVVNIEKAVKDKLPPTQIVDLLKSLKKGVVATEKLLRVSPPSGIHINCLENSRCSMCACLSNGSLSQETRVGMSVNKLRMYNDKTVSDLAKEIVAKWKQDVHQKSRPQGRPQDKSRSTASPTITSPKPKMDPSKRSKIADGIDYKVTGDKARDNCVGILYDGLCAGSDASKPNAYSHPSSDSY